MGKTEDKDIEKWIDLSVLSRWGSNGKISWSKSIGYMMDFKYDQICGKIKILEKVGPSYYKVAFYVGDEIIEHCYHSQSIIKCHFGNALRKPIAITHPSYVQYFVYPDETYLYPYSSSKIIVAKCPICGHQKEIAISSLYFQGLACPVCSDGISYPNKLMYNILSQLNIEFKKEIGKNHDGFEWAKNYKYDFYFENSMDKYFIEMDGGFHYGNGFLSYEDSHKSDEIKNQLARENGICIIRINCNYRGLHKRLDFIKNNILSSDLSTILDLSCVCWEDADKAAMENKVKLAADLWNNTEYCTKEIAEYLDLHINTVRVYLRNASKLGLCDYDKNKAYKRTRERSLCQNTKHSNEEYR